MRTMNRTRAVFVILTLVISALLLTACGGNQLVYQVTGTANQVKVTYTDGDGTSQSETVGLPWEISLKAGGSAEFSLVAQNTTEQGNIRCAVLLDEKELGHVEAQQYAGCEGNFTKSGSNLNVNFRSHKDVLPDGSPAVSQPTETPVVEVAPRTNGGGSGLLASIGRQRSWPTSRTEIFLTQFDGTETAIAPLTDGIGWAESPTWSPNGSQLLFTLLLHDHGSTYVGDLYVLDMDSFELTNLTDGPGDERGGEWSPDGRQILFVSDRDGNDDVFVIGADGSGATNLTKHGAEDSAPHWSSDGRTIYFLSDRKDDNQEIYAMDADGGNLRQLTQGDDRIRGLVVSPTGQQLAYLRGRDIYVANADGSGKTNLTNEGTQRHFPNFAWSPDGTKIAFDSARSGEMDSAGKHYNVDIYVMAADGSNVVRLTTNSEADEYPVWTPDGTMITFVSERDESSELYLVNPDGTGLTRLTEREDWHDFRPAWQPATADPQLAQLPDAPIGLPTVAPEPTATPEPTVAPEAALPTAASDTFVQGRIAFASNRDGDFEIYTVNTDGSNLVQITDNDAFDGHPAWSPDGNTILFVSDRDGNPEIYRMKPDGSDLIRLTDDPATDEFPAWSPNGQLIAFVSSRGDDADIYLMQADGSEVTPLFSNPGKDWTPAWSYTTAEIAFTSDRDGAFDLYIINAEGNVRRVTEGLGDIFSANWSPNGRFITFSAGPDGNYDIYIIRPDGTELQRITNNEAVDYMPKWSPDSNYLLFVSKRDDNPDIYVINEAGEELRVTNDPAEDISPSWGPLQE